MDDADTWWQHVATKTASQDKELENKQAQAPNLKYMISCWVPVHATLHLVEQNNNVFPSKPLSAHIECIYNKKYLNVFI